MYLNPTQHVISLWQRIRGESHLRSSILDRSIIYPNLLLDPLGAPRSRQSSPGAGSLFHDGVEIPERRLDRSVPGGYGQSAFVSTWNGGLDVRILARKKFRSLDGTGRTLDGDYEQEKVYLHCPCCDPAVSLALESLARANLPADHLEGLPSVDGLSRRYAGIHLDPLAPR